MMHDSLNITLVQRACNLIQPQKVKKVDKMVNGALNIRGTMIRRMFTGFLKKFFRFSFGGVALPGRPSLSSPVERIQSTLLENLAWIRNNQRIPLSLRETTKKHNS